MSEKSFAAKTTIPLLLGYPAIGCAFGLIVYNCGYPWHVVLLTSVLIYAGSAQYAIAGMFAAGAGYFEIAIAVFLINSRHMVYGFSLLEKFKGTRPYTPYLIFGLTDETFGLLSTVSVPATLNRPKTYFYITLLDQLYWICGGLAGYFIGAAIPFDFAGVDFALTSLFTVLLVEQWKYCANKLPFFIAAACAAIALVVAGPKHMLVLSFALAVAGIMIFRKRVEPC
jgi:4-azaleucine resistance transporter AzlC